MSEEDQKRLLRNTNANVDVAAMQMANWIADTRRVCAMVATGNQDMSPVFWIRLYGLLADISDALPETVSEELREAARISKDEIELLKPLRSAMLDLRNTFTEDELIYLQYRRHVDAHPLQSAYRVRVSRNALRGEVNHRLLGKELSIEETDKILGSIIRKFARNEKHIAEAFAKRALPYVEAIRLASIPWFGEARAAHEP